MVEVRVGVEMLPRVVFITLTNMVCVVVVVVRINRCRNGIVADAGVVFVRWRELCEVTRAN